MSTLSDGLKVVVLISAGRHPASGRSRRAPLDARAVELALGLDGASVTLLHAGDPDEPCLRDYLGMDTSEVEVVPVPAGADALDALCERLSALKPDLVLTGLRGESGEDSGMLPYMLARALGMTMAANAVALAPEEADGLRVLQAKPGGQRRAVRATLPAVVAVDAAAPAPRQIAVGPVRRGRITVLPAPAEPPADRPSDYAPAHRKPKRLKTAKGSGADRFKAATGTAGGGGTTLRDLPPEEAARRVLDFLKKEKVVKNQRS